MFMDDSIDSSINEEITISDINSLSNTSSESYYDSDTLTIYSSEEYSVIDEDDIIDEYIIELIFEDELNYLDSEKQNDNYYIGIGSRMNSSYEILYANSVTPHSFFKYSYNNIHYYLQDYSIFKTNSNIDIMKLIILDDSTYTVLIKTYWLRLIQRHWKKIYKIRKDMLSNRMTIPSIRFNYAHGHYNEHHRLPGLTGMLNKYICD